MDASVEQILELQYAGGQEDLIIVSMLDQLGVGIYREDGSVIRAGAEQSDADFYLFEPQVYGLIEMMREGLDGDTWIDFREFHAILVDFGLEATPDELVQAYSDAYAEHPDAPMTQFVLANAFLDVEAQITPLGVWLLFVDGMIPPNESSARAPSVAGLAKVAQAPTPGGIGVAFPSIQQFIQNLQAQQARAAAEASAALAGAFMTIAAPPPPPAHEGHSGNEGARKTITATLHPFAPTSPYSGQPLQGCIGRLDHVEVTWTWTNKLTAHGRTDVALGESTFTDGAGAARLEFTPKPEKMADPTHGVEVNTVATVTATASKQALVQTLCPNAPPGAARLARGQSDTLRKRVQMQISWHEPRALRVYLVNGYDEMFTNQVTGEAHTDGVDEYDGVIVEQDDGTWTGAMFATAAGKVLRGLFLGIDSSCEPAWRATQILEVFAEKRPGMLPSGDPSRNGWVFTFYPMTPPRAAYGTSLCPALRRPGERFELAPFNDARVWDPAVGLTLEYPTAIDAPGSQFATQRWVVPSNVSVTSDSDWWVSVDELQPPP